MALYTPFFERAAQSVAQGYGARRTGELAQSAYMGDQQALAELMRVNPEMGQRVQQQKMQEEQMKLSTAATQQSIAANKQAMSQSAQEFALQNREIVQNVLKEAAALPTHAAAQQYIDQQIQGLRSSGVNVPQGISAQAFTPEAYEQLRSMIPAKAPIKVDEGQTLVDPTTMQPLFTAPQATPESVRALEFRAQASGLQPGTKEYQDFMAGRVEQASTVAKEAGELRKEFSALPSVKEFAAQSSAFGRIIASADKPDAAGDLALIFNYMKMLDPGSTVREGEFATAQSAAGVPDRIRSAYNKVVDGERLAPAQRQEFTDRAQKIYSDAERGYTKLEEQYQGLAQRRGLPIEDSLVDYRYYGGTSITPTSASGAPVAGTVEDGYRFVGGDPSNPNSWVKE